MQRILFRISEPDLRRALASLVKKRLSSPAEQDYCVQLQIDIVPDGASICIPKPIFSVVPTDEQPLEDVEETDG